MIKEYKGEVVYNQEVRYHFRFLRLSSVLIKIVLG